MPKHEEATQCSMCHRRPVGDDFPRIVCPRCDATSLNDVASPARGDPETGAGDNPVFIQGQQCWRYYYPGGWVTMLDDGNCRDFHEFCKRNRLPY